MIQDESDKSIENKSLPSPGGKNQNLNPVESQPSKRIDTEKNFMETEGRVFSDFYRNTSEEMFLRSLMEGSLGMAAPSMESLGFKNLSQTIRVDSQELFNSWLTNGEIPGYNSTSIVHRNRQSSRRISTELAALSSQQQGALFQNKSSNDNSVQNSSTCNDPSSDPSQHSLRNAGEKGMQASDLFLAKAWYQSSQPMTRSRSSELRRRYAAMQNIQMSPSMEGIHNMPGQGIAQIKQEFPTTSGFCDVSIGEMSNQLRTFMSPSNSSSSPFSGHPVATVDAVSSVVSMLKGTLERKKLSNHVDKETVEGSSVGYYVSQEVLTNMGSDQGEMSQVIKTSGTFPTVNPDQIQDSRNLQIVDGSLDTEGFVSASNPIQMAAASRETSQSESSAAAPVLSTGFEVCDGPSNSGQTLSVCESSRKHVGNGNREYSSKAKEIRDRILENQIKDDRKRGSLVRMGSLTSGASVDQADPTKKRRVERSRKMAEAKERNMTPSAPSDMQAILKRCDNLEKEVRSLKLNLAFMNRKDSEQTKQIEELQKQNEELTEEKERLLEEIERILQESGRM